MIPPDEPIHPFTAALLGGALVLAIAVRIAFTHGVAMAAVALLISGFGVVFVFGVYEIATMPPDDERWEIIADAQEQNRRRFRYP